MPMMYNPAGGAPRAPGMGGNSPSNSRQTNLQRIDQAAMRKRKEKPPARGKSPALPGVPQLPVAGLPNPPQQQPQGLPSLPNPPQQQQQQPQRQPQQPYNPYIDPAQYSQTPQGAQTLGMPTGMQQQQQQQQQQGQAQLPPHVGGWMGQMTPRGGGDWPGGAQAPDTGTDWREREEREREEGAQQPRDPAQGGVDPGQVIDDPFLQQGGGTTPDTGTDWREREEREREEGGGGGAQPPQDQDDPDAGQDPRIPKEDKLPDVGAGAEGDGETGTDPYADERSQYEDLIAQAKADEEAALQGIDADIARAQRRQAEMNAAMGGAVGGGLMGGMATTATLGAREKAEATASAREKTRNLQLSWLDRQLELKERDINRKYGREMSSRDQAHQIELEAVRMGVDLPPGFQEAIDAGDYDKAVDIYKKERGGADGADGADGDGGETAYPSAVLGREGYSEADFSPEMDAEGNQSWSFKGSGGHTVNGMDAGLKFSELMHEYDLDVDDFGGILVQPQEGGPFNFGGSPAAREIQAWFGWYLDNNDGDYPGREELRSKLRQMGIM